MYTLEDIKAGRGILVNGVTKIYIVKNMYETCEKNNYMNCGYVWGYGHFEENKVILNQCF